MYSINVIYVLYFQQLLNLFSVNGTDVPKHVVVVKDYTDLSVLCAFIFFHN